MRTKASIELDRRTEGPFGLCCLPETDCLRCVASRPPGDLGGRHQRQARSAGRTLEAWCRFTRNTLVPI